LPEVLIGVGVTRFAAIAARVLTPKKPLVVSVDHIHRPLVSVAQEAQRVVDHLRKHGRATFRALISDSPETLVVVARFLSLLELYREGNVRFEQVSALGELEIIWSGSNEGEIEISDEFDIEPIMDEIDPKNIEVLNESNTKESNND
jgi:segregation and condensation protein A